MFCVCNVVVVAVVVFLCCFQVFFFVRVPFKVLIIYFVLCLVVVFLCCFQGFFFVLVPVKRRACRCFLVVTLDGQLLNSVRTCSLLFSFTRKSAENGCSNSLSFQTSESHMRK